MRTKVYKNIAAFVCLLFITTISVTICSKCSPIYPLNNWDDANCFFTVGKSVVHGNVLYKDIFEQKGPILYFIYSLAYLVSRLSFTGAYFLEIVFDFFFLVFSYLTIGLFVNRKIIRIVLLCITSIVIFSCPAFQMGGSSEEFSLPLIAVCLYISVKCIKEKQKLKKWHWVIIGITAGLILWIKFSLLGFYIGFGLFIILYYFKYHWFKELFLSFLFLLLGVIIASVPVFVYCIITSSFSDLVDVYFYNNLFMYTRPDNSNVFVSKIISLFMGALSAMKNNPLCLPLALITFIYFWKRNKSLSVLFFFEFAAAFFFIYSGGRRYAYYSLILSAFIPVGLTVLYKILNDLLLKKIKYKKSKNYLSKLLIVICVLLVGVIEIFISPNTYMLKYKKNDIAQHKFAKIINSSSQPTMLNYGFMDGGFYTASGVIPNTRFFCSLNVLGETIREEQNKYIEQGKIEYIVTINKSNEFRGYELVCSATTENRKDDFVEYYLYKKID